MALEHRSRVNATALIVITASDPYVIAAKANSIRSIEFDQFAGIFTLVPEVPVTSLILHVFSTRPDQEWYFHSLVVVGDDQRIRIQCVVNGSPDLPSPDTLFVTVLDQDPGNDRGPILVNIV